ARRGGRSPEGATWRTPLGNGTRRFRGTVEPGRRVAGAEVRSPGSGRPGLPHVSPGHPTHSRRPRSTRTRATMDDLLSHGPARFATILADPPWRFSNRTGKMAPEHRRLRRYPTLSLDEIRALPVGEL